MARKKKKSGLSGFYHLTEFQRVHRLHARMNEKNSPAMRKGKMCNALCRKDD